MNQPQSCGQGLAERSALPALMSALTDAIADNLERHQHTLDLTDDNARTEFEAYTDLARDFRNIASQLETLAERMAGYRDLPIARHDGRAMTAAAVRDAFVNLIEREHDLVSRLQGWIRQDEGILAQMNGSTTEARS